MQGNRNHKQAIGRKSVTAALIACALGWHADAMAAAPAGTQITNVAGASFSIDGGNFTLSSNPVSSCVAEILDASLVALPVTDSVALPFQLVNNGNGSEAFLMQASTTGQTSTALRIMIDGDHDGHYDPAKDTVAIENGTTPAIAAGATLTLFVLTNGNQGSTTVTARAATGTGAPGTSFAGQGQGGCDAVVGPHSGSASLQMSALPASSDAQLIKSQTVLAPNGTDSPVPDAIITYRLDAVLRSGPALKGASITDTIPTGTTYVAGSITLDGQPVADTGHFDGTAIKVALGDIDQPTTRTVTFKVKIQ